MGFFLNFFITKLSTKNFTPIAGNVLQLGVRFLAYRNVQVTTKLNSQKLTLRYCYR